MAEKKYVVWKRNDGYIDVSTGMPNDYVTGGNPPLTPGWYPGDLRPAR
jgi:hypothetical protein